MLFKRGTFNGIRRILDERVASRPTQLSFSHEKPMHANAQLNRDRVPDLPSNTEAFNDEVRRLTETYVLVWNESREVRPVFVERYSGEQKLQNQRACERLLERAGSFSGDGRDIAGSRFKLQRQIADILFAPDDLFARQFSSECGDAATSFIRRAKRFDPLIREDDVHQALRNFWTFNSLQSYLGYPVAFTSSSFAYSLLYPYTDNVLDTLGRAGEKKGPFLRWLDLALHGERPVAADRLTRTVGRLLRMIEAEYPRPDYPDVHQSLLAIHRAQRDSLTLCVPSEHANEERLLRVTVAKGGTSVLADGFLVDGNLKSFDREALFGFGVLLQLIDDFRDMEEDIASGISTPFTRVRKEKVLDQSTNQLFAFVEKVLSILRSRASTPDHPICRLIDQSCRFLIQEGIARNPDLYSRGYVDWIGPFIPVPLPYLGELRSRLKEERKGIPEIVEL